MEKIIVTEEQAKNIDDILIEANEEGYQVGYVVNELSLTPSLKGLNIVTIARIVEGEPYEVIRPLKVGDIVISEWGKVIQIVEEVTNDSDKLSVNTVNNSDFKYTLVCKVEDREDFKIQE